MRFSFKFLLFVVLVAALLIASFVMPETKRETTAKRVLKFEKAKIEYTASSLHQKDPRRLFFGDNAGRRIRKIELPYRYKRKLDQPEFAGFNDEDGSAAIQSILADWRALTHLESLVLPTMHPITSKTIEHLGKLKALRFVHIKNAAITSAGADALGGMENLEALWLDGCQFSADDFSSLSKLEHLGSVRIAIYEKDESPPTAEALVSMRSAASSAYVQIKYGYQYRKKFWSQHQAKLKAESAAGK